MAKEFMDIDGIREFLNKMVTAPTVTDADNVLATKDGKLVQMDSTEIASNGLKLYKEDTANSVITLLDRLQIEAVTFGSDAGGVSIKAVGTLDDLRGLVSLHALREMNTLYYLGSLGTLNNLYYLGTLGSLGTLSYLGSLGSLDTLNHLGSLNNLDYLGSLGTLNNLYYLGTLGSLGTLSYLNSLDCLNHLGSLNNLDYLGSLGTLNNLYYLDYLGTLNHLGSLNNLDDLGALGTLNNLYYLDYLGTLHHLGSLNNLDYLGSLGTLGSLNNLDYLGTLGSLDTLNHLGTLNSLDYLGSLDTLNNLYYLDYLGTLSYLDYLGTLGTMNYLYNIRTLDRIGRLEYLGKANPMAEIRAVDAYLNDDGVHYLASVGKFNEDIGAAKLILGYDYEGNRSVGIYKCTGTDGSDEDYSKYLKLSQIIRNIEKIVDYMEDKPKHIQYVSALPDSPDEDTLYLIPEWEETTEITVDFSMSSVLYATIILPFNYELPEGLSAYGTVEVVDTKTGEIRYGDETTSLIANRPYVIRGTDSSIGSYQFTGVPTANIKYKYNNGQLVGIYKNLSTDDGSFRMDGTEHVLQSVNGVATWCPITSASEGLSVGAYRCYIDVTLK